jgi:hypothetical protein
VPGVELVQYIRHHFIVFVHPASIASVEPIRLVGGVVVVFERRYPTPPILIVVILLEQLPTS